MDSTKQLFDAIHAGDVETLGRLLAGEPALANARNDGGMAPLMMATYFGRRDVADLLIERGAEVDIFVASALGLPDRVEQILRVDQGAIESYSPDGWTPLHLASHFGHAEVVSLLLEQGASVTARSKNDLANMPLHAALAGGHRPVAELLLAHGADVNATQHGGFTPLHAAAENGDPEMVRLLLAQGADSAARADDGRSAIDFANEAGHSELQILLR
jgi:ankyrin repeat protein